MAPPCVDAAFGCRAHPLARGARVARRKRPSRNGRLTTQRRPLPTSGASRHRIARSMQRAQLFPRGPARRFAARACGGRANRRRTARHPWRAANTNTPVRYLATAPLGPLPLSITPTSFNATRRPRLGQRRVVAHCRCQDRTRRFPHAFGCAFQRRRPLPDSRPNASAPGRTATGSSDATSGSGGPSAVSTTQP
jgi:hypothetical protein